MSADEVAAAIAAASDELMSCDTARAFLSLAEVAVPADVAAGEHVREACALVGNFAVLRVLLVRMGAGDAYGPCVAQIEAHGPRGAF